MASAAMPLRILILSGPTREPLDPVRYISNASSGLQGRALVEEALGRGHAVDLIEGPVALEPPAGALFERVTSAAEMLARAIERHPSCDALIAAAAVSDFRPLAFSSSKRKRGAGGWTLELVPTEDILLALAARKGDRVHAGFALETEEARENGRRKLREKRLDWIAVNSPAAIGAGGGDYCLLGADGSCRELGRLSKRALAAKLLDAVEETARGRRG
jgi:phosphopantothenoylcysteine decarboxylase/phosphopantothenate--cysteine ligase